MKFQFNSISGSQVTFLGHSAVKQCFTIYYNRSRIQLVTVEKQKLMMIIIVTFYTDQQMIIAHLRISTCELKNDFEKYSIQS
ncbi:hypothetical protein T03_3676 [Trichinella britovi]|uniref:Uncharacterized protein n=1 Tax=Trichinella britovi TaxID=45882 RepID=A0A0V1CK42_TRIBR|nr:hypothetical protein T09_3335 [Trichinella sp. T9]KRY49528.1 hypothetical protein T03_3676 [Trichinella britovi]KRZ86551.1 hypothetical protein T08_836 [Trichinella sp. T8]